MINDMMRMMLDQRHRRHRRRRRRRRVNNSFENSADNISYIRTFLPEKQLKLFPSSQHQVAHNYNC